MLLDGSCFCGPCGAASACFFSIARGLRAPRGPPAVALVLKAPPRGASRDPGGTFCVNKKYPKSHLNLRFKNPFLGAALGRPPRRGSKGLCGGVLGKAKPPKFQYFFCRSGTCRTPPAGLSKGYCLQGAHGLTEHSSDSHLHRQTLVPRAARQPGCRDGRWRCSRQ